MRFDLTPAEHKALSARPDDPISVLLQTGQRPAAKRLLLNHVMLALGGDMLNFLYESLSALEKRKFVVAYALLRKPLQQNLIFLSWLLVDEEGFFSAFEKSPAATMTGVHLKPEKKKEIIERAIELTNFEGIFKSDLIFDIIFERNLADGLAILFHKANHLVTSHGKALQTEDLNFNFIFKNPLDNDVYENLYGKFGYVLLYLFAVQSELFSKVLPIDRLNIDRIVFVAVAVFESLFMPGRSRMTGLISRVFSDFLKCPVCDARFRLSKRIIPRLLISERADCASCGADFRFPILWLLDRGKIKLRPDD